MDLFSCTYHHNKAVYYCMLDPLHVNDKGANKMGGEQHLLLHQQ